MARMSNRVDRAVGFFAGGCACSQAVFGAFAPDFGLDEETAVRVASGFAGGMKMGETCGALTGAFMALGLARAGETSRTVEGRAAVGALVVECARQFRARQGGLDCRDILGCDISTEEGRQHAKERNLFKTRCVEAVRDAATIADTMV
jgi:C_GCAxxG_C_C family probable redox protein